MRWKTSLRWDLISKELLSGIKSVGIFVERDGLTLVNVQKGLTGYEMCHFAYLPRWEEDWEATTIRLRDLVSHWDLGSYPVSLAVTKELGFVRQVVLPAAAAENLSQVVNYEMDRFMPMAPEGLYHDFQILQKTDTEIHLLIMALPRKRLEGCLNLMAQAGLQPFAIELDSTAIVNAFTLLGSKLSSTWLLLRPEAGGYELTMMRGRARQAHRLVQPAPGKSMTARLLAEINQLHTDGFAAKVVCLAMSKAENFEPDKVSRESGVTVTFPDQLPVKNLAEAVDMGRALPALGTALRGLKKMPLQPNLLPEAERSGAKITGFYLTKVLFMAVLGLACLWMGSTMVQKRVALYRADRVLSRLEPESRQVSRQLGDAQKMAQQLDSFRRQYQKYPGKLIVLKELTELIPDSTWLVHLRFTQQQVELEGVSRSAAELIPILERSRWLSRTEFTSPIVTDANGREHFKIKAEIKSLGLGS